MSICRKPYLFDVHDDELSLVASYLLLQRADAGEREHDLREVFDRLRYVVKTGAPWRCCRPRRRCTNQQHWLAAW